MGCHRSVDEIIAWGSADDAARHTILAAAERRRRARATPVKRQETNDN